MNNSSMHPQKQRLASINPRSAHGPRQAAEYDALGMGIWINGKGGQGLESPLYIWAPEPATGGSAAGVTTSQAVYY